jgi:hypothetical protein
MKLKLCGRSLENRGPPPGGPPWVAPGPGTNLTGEHPADSPLQPCRSKYSDRCRRPGPAAGARHALKSPLALGLSLSGVLIDGGSRRGAPQQRELTAAKKLTPQTAAKLVADGRGATCVHCRSPRSPPLVKPSPIPADTNTSTAILLPSFNPVQLTTATTTASPCPLPSSYIAH